MKKKYSSWSIAVAGALLFTACGGDDSSTDSSPNQSSSVDVSSDVAAANIDISDVWARTSPAMTSLGAVYMSIKSSIDDELVSVVVDPSIAGSAEVHETMTAPMHSNSMPMNHMSGEMSMREVASIAIPAGETVQLMPGGYHIMLIGLVAPLELGQTFEVTLTFANAGQVVVIAEVRDEAP